MVDLRLKYLTTRRKVPRIPNIKWWNLKNEKVDSFSKDMIDRGIWDLQEDFNKY